MPSIDDADNARGARVEIAAAAAEKGDVPVVLGVLGGMSADERAVFGPQIVRIARANGHAALAQALVEDAA